MSETDHAALPMPTDGRVEARGSVWKIHFESGSLDEAEVARHLRPLGVVKVEQVVTTGVARVTPTIKN